MRRMDRIFEDHRMEKLGRILVGEQKSRYTISIYVDRNYKGVDMVNVCQANEGSTTESIYMRLDMAQEFITKFQQALEAYKPEDDGE